MLLVTGTSGVGKTFTIEAAMRSDPSLVRMSGSGILREIGRPIASLTKEAALLNQEAIVDYLTGKAVAKLQNVLFDGHAVLETSEGLLPVPFDVVKRMRLSGVALIQADTLDVATRRSKKNRISTTPVVSHLQHAEEAHSREIADRLAVPHAIVPSGDTWALLCFLGSVRRSDAGDSR